MSDIFVPLRLTHGVNGVYLRSLRGADEMLVTDVSTRTALLFLEQLVHKLTPHTVLHLKAAKIVTADRDRIFAALYMNLYGSKIESTITCRHCSTPFDLDFSLAALLEHYQLTPAEEATEGVFQIAAGASFRLPTGADELLLGDIAETRAEDFLLSQCLIKGDLKENGPQVQEKMAEIAPVLNLSMQAHCPECGTSQEVHFDIQTFFLTRLKQEQPLLIKEVHRIAKCYHWNAADILNLPRNLRKQYVAMIESEL